jgi:hypothetical protein
MRSQPREAPATQVKRKSDLRARSSSNNRIHEERKKPYKEPIADRRTEHGKIGGQNILFDLDYMREEKNVRALQDYNHINEEAIIKL